MDQHEKSYQKAKDRMIKEITKNGLYKEFFSQYIPSSVKYFITRFAHHKANLEVYGDYTKYSQQSLLEGWQRSAWECLEQIQNKKLFDLACKWHAEEVRNLPEIEISIDFDSVQSHILDYSAIPDISEDDIDFYLRFLNSNEHVVDFYSSNIGFSIFQRVKDCYEEHNQTGSQYFDFHNTYTGNNRFLSLPNIRGNKEDEYMDLGCTTLLQ